MDFKKLIIQFCILLILFICAIINLRFAIKTKSIVENQRNLINDLYYQLDYDYYALEDSLKQ